MCCASYSDTLLLKTHTLENPCRGDGWVGQPVLRIAKDKLRYGVVVGNCGEGGCVLLTLTVTCRMQDKLRAQLDGETNLCSTCTVHPTRWHVLKQRRAHSIIFTHSTHRQTLAGCCEAGPNECHVPNTRA